MALIRVIIASLLLPAALLAQDKVLGEAIDHFKGAADEARKANPLLAAGTGDGVTKVIKSLGSRRSYGKAPVNVELPKEQQEELDRRQKARERAEQLAKSGPRRAAAPKPAVSSLPAVTPLVLLAIQNPTPKPRFTLINEDALNQITPGQLRADVLATLGTPSTTAAVRGLEDGDRELLTYHLTPVKTVAIRLLAGVVTAVTR